MTLRPALPSPIIGIALDDTLLSAVVVVGGQLRPETLQLPPTVSQDGAKVVAGTGVAARSDAVRVLADDALVPLYDTYFPAEHLVAVLLAALRLQAEHIAQDLIHTAAIAHPLWWSERSRTRLLQAAHSAGLADVALWPAPEAAAWAKVPPPDPPVGVMVVVDLGANCGVALLTPTRSGPRLAAHAPLDRHGELRDVVHDLVATHGVAWKDVRDVRVIGGCADNPATVAAIARELGLRPRVPDRPAVAAAAGAVRRYLRRFVPRQRAAHARLDITERLSRFAQDRDARGDPRTAWRARALAQEIFDFRVGMHTPAPTTAFAAALDEAERLVEGA